MPKYIVKDASVTLNSVNLSTRVAQVAIIMEADDVDVSTMGTGVHEHLAGLRSDRFEITFVSDFDVAMVDATLAPLLATATTQPTFPVVVKPTSAAVSATNPSYTSSTCILLNYSPLAGEVGSRSETAVVIVSNVLIVRATA